MKKSAIKSRHVYAIANGTRLQVVEVRDGVVTYRLSTGHRKLKDALAVFARNVDADVTVTPKLNLAK